MQEPNERRFEDQQGHDIPTVPYNEPQNPYAAGETKHSHDESQNPYAEAVHHEEPQNPYGTDVHDEQPAAASEPIVSPLPPSNSGLDGENTQPEAAPSTFYGQPPLDASGQPLLAGNLTAGQNSRRGNLFWFAMGALSMLLVGIILSTSTYFVYSYVNRSTPMKTLDAFCDALRVEDYEGAYQSLSRKFQDKLTEIDFEQVLAQDKVIGCTHGNADESRSVASTSLKLVHMSQGINNDIVTLTKDTANNWKINDLSDATGG